MQLLTKNLGVNKSANPNFIRSSQESSSTNSLVINTNNSTKWKSDESSKIEQIEADQTSNSENEEIDDDNIPLNKFYKCRHTTITKHWRKKKDLVTKDFNIYYINQEYGINKYGFINFY